MEEDKKIKIIREVLAVSIFGISVYLLYAIFLSNSNSTVGLLGVLVKNFIFLIFGLISYILPFAFFMYSIVLFKNNSDIKIRRDQLLSLLLFLLFSSSLLIVKDMFKDFLPNTPLFFGSFRPSLILYLFPLVFLMFFSFYMFFKKEKINRLKLVIYSFLLISTFALMILNHNKISDSFDFIIAKLLDLSLNGSSGGAFGGIVALPFFILFGSIGSLIILSTLSIASLTFFANKLIKSFLYILIDHLSNWLKIFVKPKSEIISSDKTVEDIKYGIKKDLNEIDEVHEVEEVSEIEEIEVMTNYTNHPIKPNQQFQNKNIEKIPTFFKTKKVQKIERKVEEKYEKENSQIIEPEELHRNLDNIFKKEKKNPELKEKLVKAVKENASKLEAVLDEHGIEARVIDYKIGPTITRYELTVSKGTRVKQVLSLSDDIAMNLEAKSIRIEAPIPGKNAIGVEVPNIISEDVSFASIIRNKKSNKPLDIVLGKNLIGEDVIVDLREMPHLLIAGRTGSGKSVGVNCIISSIIYNASAEDVKFIMIDPKMVELMPYNGIPHLYVPVIIDPKLASVALKWCVNEMESRYRTLAQEGVRNLESYNQQFPNSKLPYIVVVIDELADLMMTSPASVEESIARISQKARAIGIHLVIATQRPSTDVITGTIKANLPSRIAFAVTSYIDSRTIIDVQGAEKLLGKGDMLYLESGKPYLVRIQGAYISDKEVIDFTTYLKRKSKPSYNDEILRAGDEVEKDVLYEKALEVLKEEGRASTTLIQRKLGVGYSRAARIMDQLEEAGVIKIGKNGEKELLI